jgi:integrase
MATVKIVTWSRKNKDGQYPIGIKISTSGKPSYIFEGHTVPSRECWDQKKQEVKKSVPNAARLTNLLFQRLAEIKAETLKAETEKQKPTAQSIKKAVKDEPADAKPVHFKEIADTYLAELWENGKYDVHRTDTSRLNRFYEFNGSGDIPFSEVHSELLRRYTLFLRRQKKRNGNKDTPPRPLSERTIMNHLLIIRTLWNRAIIANVASRDDYPFGAKNKISIKFPESKKIGLDFHELSKLETINLSAKPRLHHARNICLVSFYFAGMRITDALLMKWSDFQSGRFHYVMSKNGEPGSLKVPLKAEAIIKQYREDEQVNDLIFPYLKRLDSLDDRIAVRKAISSAAHAINEAIKAVVVKIGSSKSVSPHKFRHAFAQRAEDMNVHPKVLQKLYRHESILTTMIYQSNFSHHKADEALDLVVDF